MDLNCLINYNLLTFESIDSTNAEAIRLAKSGVSGNLLITAKVQTNGRGQRGRNWQSLEGNLHLTIMIETAKNLPKLAQLTFLTANILADTIESVSSNKASIQLKWPNDVLINGEKVAGILLESVKVNDKQFVIIGIGVNVKKAPIIENHPVCSLLKCIDFKGDAEEFMYKLVKNFDKCYLDWDKDEDFLKIRLKWLTRAYNINKVVTVDNGERRISGLFREIGDDGAIIVELASGETYKLTYGEVIHNLTT